MATLKLTIDKRKKNKTGKYPIVIRLTSKGLSTSIPTKINVFEEEWDSSGMQVFKIHPNHKELNLVLNKKLLELEKRLMQHTLADGEFDIKELKAALINKQHHKTLTFNDFALQEIDALKKQGRYGNAQAYQTALNRFVVFIGSGLMLDKITYSTLCDFETCLIKEGIRRNSIAVYMRGLRALLNKAINKGLLDESKYPFKKYVIRVEKTASRAITKADLEKIRKLNLEKNSSLWHSRNIFFLIFNLIGISLIDLVFLRLENLVNGRIVYNRRKTGKMYSIKLTDEAVAILELYRSDSPHYLINIIGEIEVPRYKERHEVNLKNKILNRSLKKIGSMAGISILITTYVARYSWANIAKAMGYSKDLIAEALGHEYGNRITGIYLDNYGNQTIDDVNERVTSFNSKLL